MLIKSRTSLYPGLQLDTKDDYQNDGCFVGAQGQVYPATTDWHDITPVYPDNGKAAWRTVLMINGIMTDVALQSSDMQRMANTGYKVIGVHNATKGMLMDLAQCMGDKLDLTIANNGATATVAKVLQQTLEKNQEPPLLVGHSQGALVISNALKRINNEKLKNLEVFTLGGASWTFPLGPHYRHYINVFDAVPMGAGVGALSWLTCSNEDQVNRFAELKQPHNLPALEDGISNYMARLVDRSVHGPQDIYIPKLEPTT